MARKLKTYQTAQGFFDMAIAVPSMKAALQAWGMTSNIFHQGFAWESKDARVIDATMKAPGVTLRRAVGTKGPFVEHPSLPKQLPAHVSGDRYVPPSEREKQPKGGRTPKKLDAKAARKAAAAFEKRQRRIEAQQKREAAVLARETARRELAAGKIQAQLDKATQQHERTIADLDKERAALESRVQAEETRWDKATARLEQAKRRIR